MKFIEELYLKFAKLLFHFNKLNKKIKYLQNYLLII